MTQAQTDAAGNEIWSVEARTEEDGAIIALSTPYLDYGQAIALADAIYAELEPLEAYNG